MHPCCRRTRRNPLRPRLIRHVRYLHRVHGLPPSVTPDTVRNYERRYPTVAAAIQEAREATTDTAESALYDAILERQPWAVTFYLKTQGRNRGYGDRVELAGDQASPLRVRLVWPEERTDDA